MLYSSLDSFQEDDINSLFNNESIYKGSSAELLDESKGTVWLSTLIY